MLKLYTVMNLVFFDIECASVNKTTAKICAFGYVIADENFNIIKKEDILINPRGGFHLTDRKGDKGLVLPYEYGEFKNYPPFPKVYGYIKSLLEDENNIVLGHSTMNDIKYLNLETKRFKLPPFRFSFSDSQLIYMALKDDYTRQMGLGTIASELGVEFTAHRAADDAYATMRVVEAMCKARGCDYFTLVRELEVTEGKIRNFNITPPYTAGEKRYHESKERERRESAKKRIVFFNYVSRLKCRRGKLSGKAFTFSRSIENDVNLAKSLVSKIYSLGGTYTQHITHSDYYIASDGDQTQRTQGARKAANLTVTDIEGLEEMLND